MRPKACAKGNPGVAISANFAVIAKVIDEPRRILNDIPAAVDLAVDHAERVLFESCLAVLTHCADVRSEIVLEQFVVFAAAVRTADGIDVERDVLKTHLPEEDVNYRDDLCIDIRSLCTERFKAELVELTHSALLHLLITESGNVVKHPYRSSKARHAVLNIASDDACSTLRSQSDASATLVLKGIHLFGYNVCGIANAPLEQICLLKCRDPYLLIAEGMANIRKSLLCALPIVYL